MSKRHLVSDRATCAIRAAALLLLAVGAAPARAQFGGPDFLPAPGIQRNSVSVLQAQGDSLWVGPAFSLTPDGGQTWYAVQSDLLQGTENRVFSLDAEGGAVVAGLVFTGSVLGEPEPAVAGFLVSTDGGRTFRERPSQIDLPGADTLVQFGASTIDAYPVFIPEEGAPYGVDYDRRTGYLWVAGWYAGLRRSHIDSLAWERVVLPPDNRDAIHPDSVYTFSLDPRAEQGGSYNHRVLSVLVDEEGTVWAGTEYGVNRSTDGGRSWRRFTYNGTPNSLVGNTVLAIEEQPLESRNAVWMATAASKAGPRTRGGATVTRDGGETFEQALVGESVFDFAFDGDTVYAAGGESGLFVSGDGGRTWRAVRDFTSARTSARYVPADLRVLSVAVTPGALWAGTSEGLFRSMDGGETWTVFRADVPVSPAQPTEAVPQVDTYAYPNPFSPDNAPYVTRIRYELDAAADVDVRILDFEMGLVQRLEDAPGEAGANEVAWDGTDDDGLRVANGVYFYAVRSGDRTRWGKILVLQ